MFCYDLARIVRNSFEFIWKNGLIPVRELIPVLADIGSWDRQLLDSGLDSRFSIPGSRFQVLDSGFLISSSKFWTLGYRKENPPSEQGAPPMSKMSPSVWRIFCDQQAYARKWQGAALVPPVDLMQESGGVQPSCRPLTLCKKVAGCSTRAAH